MFAGRFGGRPDPAEARRGLDPRRLARVFDLIEANLGAELTLDEVAAVAAFSPFHFARSFRAATGWAPHRYVTIRRLERARALLLRGDTSVVAIAAAVGFSNVSHFRRLFRRDLGVLPSEVRRDARPAREEQEST